MTFIVVFLKEKAPSFGIQFSFADLDMGKNQFDVCLLSNVTAFLPLMSGNEAGTRATTWYTWSGRVRSIYKTKDKEGK